MAFTPAILYLCGGLIVWIARFIAVYGFTGIACARGWDRSEVLGVATIPGVIWLSAAVAIAACAGLIAYAAHGLRAGELEDRRFLHVMAALVAGIAIVAMVYESLPPLFLPSCRA